MEKWVSERIRFKGGKMRVEARVRYDVSAIRCTVGYVFINRVHAWSGDTLEDLYHDYDLHGAELGTWIVDLERLVKDYLEERLWEAV